MLDEIMQTINEEYKLCWKHPNNEQFHWAQQVESLGGHHGLGDLNKPCEPLAPGKECPACGRRF